MSHYLKDPDSVLDYTVDWTDWLTAAADTATTAVWTVPDGLTQPQEPELVGGKATVWLGGGTLGDNHTVTCRLTTAAGRVDDRSIKVAIRER